MIGERTHLHPKAGVEGHFNVSRGWIVDPTGLTGVNVVRDFHDNYKENRPSEYGILAFSCPETDEPRGLLDATARTAMRTGAIMALGAKYLARRKPLVFGHIGTPGFRLLEHPAAQLVVSL